MIPPHRPDSTGCRRWRWLAATAVVLGLGSTLAAADTSALVVWEDNVTNTTATGGRLSSWMIAANATDEIRRPLARDDALYLGASLTGNLCPDYHGLDELTAGPHLAWVHKFGLGAFAPLLRLEAAVAGIGARESYRSGWNRRVGFTWGQRFTDALRLDVSGERNHTEAHDEVFTKTADTLAAELAYDFNDVWRLKARVGWRNGDVVSYYRAYWTAWGWQPAGYNGYGNGYGYSAGSGQLVDTFGSPYLAYRVRAHTWSYSATVSPALGPDTALVLSYEYGETQNSSVRYVNQLLSAGVVHRF